MGLTPATGHEPMLAIEHIRKSFRGTTALDDVSMTVAAGEIRAVVGSNGAGKSTLMKILRGAYRADEGRISLSGRRINPRRPAEADDLGIAMIYQELSVLPDLDVAENIMLTCAPPRPGRFLLDRSRLYGETAALVKRLGVELPLTRLQSQRQRPCPYQRSSDAPSPLAPRLPRIMGSTGGLSHAGPDDQELP